MIARIAALFLILLLSACEQKSEPNAGDPSSKIDNNLAPQTQAAEAKKETSSASNNNDKPVERNFFVAADDIVLGNKDSKVVLVEVFSPTCPHCVSYHKHILPELRKKYVDNNKIAYVVREFIGSKQDFDAASLLRCKGDVDNYFKFLDAILTSQNSWATSKNYREILTNIAGLGLVSPEEFAKCINDSKIGEILAANTKLVAAVKGFGGTPSFFINGELFVGRYTAEDLGKALDKYLNASSLDE